MKAVKKVIFALSIMGYVGATGAVPITITDMTLFNGNDAYDSVSGDSDLNGFGRGDVNYLSTDVSQFFAGDFDYVVWTQTFDYDPSWGAILDGSLSLALRDDSDELFSADFGVVFTEDGNIGFGGVSTSTYDFNLATDFLEDGSFTVALASILGGFYIDSSVLSVTYDEDTVSSVPEPTTLSIFGVALLLIGFINQKRHGNST